MKEINEQNLKKHFFYLEILLQNLKNLFHTNCLEFVKYYFENVLKQLLKS